MSSLNVLPYMRDIRCDNKEIIPYVMRRMSCVFTCIYFYNPFELSVLAIALYEGMLQIPYVYVTR